MYLPDYEIERVAVSMIADFGEDAEHQVSGYVKSARVRRLGPTVFIWERVRQRVVELNGGDIHEALEAA
jgi:hypothetical protein